MNMMNIPPVPPNLNLLLINMNLTNDELETLSEELGSTKHTLLETRSVNRALAKRQLDVLFPSSLQVDDSVTAGTAELEDEKDNDKEENETILLHTTLSTTTHHISTLKCDLEALTAHRDTLTARLESILGDPSRDALGVLQKAIDVCLNQQVSSNLNLIAGTSGNGSSGNNNGGGGGGLLNEMLKSYRMDRKRLHFLEMCLSVFQAQAH